MGWLTNPKKAAYNRVYNKTSKGCAVVLVALCAGMLGLSAALAGLFLN
jgi:hypothetical protein